MPDFNTEAILLRRVEYGDSDLILTFLSRQRGKIAVIAKAAKKSKKRFAGTLELFCLLQLVISETRSKGLAVLKEADLLDPFEQIRVDIQKTAYASYWTEMLYNWLEKEQPQPRLFALLKTALATLGGGTITPAVTSILFQMQFLSISGLAPNLSACCHCRADLTRLPAEHFAVDLLKGGLVCSRCGRADTGRLGLRRQTILQLRWVQSGDWDKACRMRFSPTAIGEAEKFLEAFVPYHLGKTIKSLKILQQIRG